MTLHEAFKLFEFENETFTAEELKKRYKKLARKFHPDANNGVDLGFNILGEAYCLLNSYLGDEKKCINSKTKNDVVFSFLIWNNIFGIDFDNSKRVAEIYRRLEAEIIENDSEFNDEKFKETIIEVFKLKYAKSFKLLGIADGESYFDSLNTHHTFEDTYIKLSCKYERFYSRKYLELSPIALRYFKQRAIINIFITNYIQNLLLNGINGSPEDFKKYIENIISEAKENAKKDGNVEDDISLKYEEFIGKYLNMNRQDDKASELSLQTKYIYNHLDVVYSNIGGSKFGIVIEEDDKKYVLYYLFNDEESRVFKKVLRGSTWKKIDDFIDRGSIVSPKVIRLPYNEIVFNVLIYDMKDGKYLIANSDYSRFEVISTLYDSNYMSVIDMWPEYLSKKEIKKIIKEKVLRSVLPDICKITDVSSEAKRKKLS